MRLEANSKVTLNYLIYVLLLCNQQIAMQLANNRKIPINSCIDITNDILKAIQSYKTRPITDEEYQKAFKRLKLEQGYKANYNTTLSLAINNSYDDIAISILNRDDINLSTSVAESNYLILSLKLSKNDIANSILDRSLAILEEDKDRALNLNRYILKGKEVTSTLMEVMHLSEDNEIVFKMIDHSNFEINNQINGISYLQYAIIENNKEVALKLISNNEINLDIKSKGLC